MKFLIRLLSICKKLVAKNRFCFCLFVCLFVLMGFTSCKSEQPLGDMELQVKEIQKD